MTDVNTYLIKSDIALYRNKTDEALSYLHEALEKCKLADVKFTPNTFKPKFDLLNAMIEAKQNRLDDYVQSLNKIITKHNGTPEQEMAKK